MSVTSTVTRDTGADTRTCRKCNVAHPLGEFHKKDKHTCIPCYKERAREYSKAYKAANKERISAYNRAYNLANRATIQPRSSRNYQRLLDTDPAFKMAHALRCRVRKVLQGISKSANTLALLGCTGDEFRRWLEFNFSDGMTFANHGSLWHIDHVIPCSKWDLSDPEQQRQCFHWANMKPMLARANCSKNGNLVPAELPLHVGRVMTFLGCADLD